MPSATDEGSSALPEAVRVKLEGLPASPGCYLFRGAGGEVLYVGKAKSLRSRVRSYFQAGSSDQRVYLPHLLERIVDLETIVTSTEKEAAILENSLVKERQPRFNVKLRDDKEYLTLRLRTSHEWPRLELVRRPEADGARYFGPYHSATAARRTAHLVEKHFQLRTCSDRELASRRRPCLQYQIKRCPAPCVKLVDAGLYADEVRRVELFLAGRHDELTAELERRMAEAAEGLEYELAAMYRDQLRAVAVLREQQRVVAASDRDQAVLGLYREGDLVELAVLEVRGGRVVEAGSLSQLRTELAEDEIVAAFLRERYGEEGAALLPDELLVPVLPDGAAGVAEWLTERREAATGRRGARVVLTAPQRGAKHALLELAQENARHAFAEKRRATDDVEARLARLQAKLRLPTLPRRIECSDISHLGGEDTVGAVVALVDGQPDPARYRSYRVRSAGPGDDYAAQLEVLSRRFARGRAASEGEADGEGWDLPDLFVVDGGRGQLAVALTAARDLGLHELAIVGLAKERESATGEELVDRVYLPGQKNPVALRPNSPELHLLALARDEAHRFSNRGRKKVGRRRRLASRLDDVPGIGPSLRKALLRALGSVDGIRRAPDDAVLAVRGISAGKLSALRLHLGREGDEGEDDGEVPPEGAPPEAAPAEDGPPEGGAPSEPPAV